MLFEGLPLALYFLVFACCFTAGVFSTLKRGRERYGLNDNRIHILRDLHIFFAAVFTFYAASFGNMLLYMEHGAAAFVWIQLLAIAALFAFAGFMELRYREGAGLLRRELLDEMDALVKGLERDPENAAWLERLAELHERTGEIKAAVARLEELSTLQRKNTNMKAAEVAAEKARELALAAPPDSPFFALAAGYFRFLADLLKSAGRVFRLRSRGLK